jgi:hypothetical protein
MNKGCRVSYCGNMPKFEVKAIGGALPVCRNHLSQAVEEVADENHGSCVVELRQVSDLEYLRTENGRLRRRLREMGDSE